MTDIERIQKGLHCSQEEAKEVYLCDKAIDRGEKMDFDLSDEAHKQSMKMANTKTHKSNKQPVRHVCKKNKTKNDLVLALAEFMKEYGAIDVNVENIDRLITFELNEHKYDLTLIQKRK